MTRDAFAQEFERARHALWVVAIALLNDRADAEDIVQEAAAVGLGKLDQFEPGTSFVAWMSQIVRHLASNLRHKAQRRRTHATDTHDLDLVRTSDSTPPATAVNTFGQLRPDQDSFDDAVVNALTNLDETARACVLLRSVKGLSYREISGILNVPEGTAMSHVHRARRVLRERLESPPATLAVTHPGRPSTPHAPSTGSPAGTPLGTQPGIQGGRA